MSFDDMLFERKEAAEAKEQLQERLVDDEIEKILEDRESIVDLLFNDDNFFDAVVSMIIEAAVKRKGLGEKGFDLDLVMTPLSKAAEKLAIERLENGID